MEREDTPEEAPKMSFIERHKMLQERARKNKEVGLVCSGCLS